jgi:hypothetical protein
LILISIALVGLFPHISTLPITLFGSNSTLVLFVGPNIAPVRLSGSFIGLDISFTSFLSPNSTPGSMARCTLDDHALVALVIDVDRVRALVLHELVAFTGCLYFIQCHGNLARFRSARGFDNSTRSLNDSSFCIDVDDLVTAISQNRDFVNVTGFFYNSDNFFRACDLVLMKDGRPDYFG